MCVICVCKLKDYCIPANGEISNITTNKYEFTLVYNLSGSPVPSIRPVCLIPFVCHILGTELPRYGPTRGNLIYGSIFTLSANND